MKSRYEKYISKTVLHCVRCASKELYYWDGFSRHFVFCAECWLVFQTGTAGELGGHDVFYKWKINQPDATQEEKDRLMTKILGADEEK